MVEDYYNTKLQDGKGTLIGNWYEERSLRDFTGVGRTIVKEHIPKRHLDFENPITGKTFDNTYDRINGVTRPEAMITENREYGTAKNAADYLPMVGRKTQNFEREIQRKVAQEMQERLAQEEALRQERYFDTTNKEVFVNQDLTANTIGRKVMKTQDGKLVPEANRDD